MLFILREKLSGKCFKNWLEKVIIGNIEKIIAYFMYRDVDRWRFHAK